MSTSGQQNDLDHRPDAVLDGVACGRLGRGTSKGGGIGSDDREFPARAGAGAGRVVVNGFGDFGGGEDSPGAAQ
ncbi:hypothetical protein BIV25_20235 [Streptomyces sp. MUSC 14]|nr:hypothetical protein BIV25_20235 [Streptomyces sp. MUSC 14]